MTIDGDREYYVALTCEKDPGYPMGRYERVDQTEYGTSPPWSRRCGG